MRIGNMEKFIPEAKWKERKWKLEQEIKKGKKASRS